MGRPSKYQTHVQPYLDKIAEWVSNGAAHDDIANNLHITESTLELYLKKGRDGEEPYSEFSDCFARAIQEPNENVEAALYKLSTGYTVDLQKTFKIKRSKYDPKTGRKIEEYEELVTGIDQVHVPANVNAQIFYLTNRVPEKWKHKPDDKTDSGDSAYCGIVELPAVMDAPEPPEYGGAGSGGENG